MTNSEPPYITLGPEPTFHAMIYCGLKNTKTGHIHDSSRLYLECQRYVDAVGLCVSFRIVDYIYTNGREPGVMVGLLNYPRFPSTPEIIRRHALVLGEKLRVAAEQERVTISTNTETVTLQDASIPHPSVEREAGCCCGDCKCNLYAHIGDLDVQCLHDKAPFLKEHLSVRDRETLLMLCYWYKRRHEDPDHKQACARVQERNREMEMEVRRLKKDKWALVDKSFDQNLIIVDQRKRIESLEHTIAHMAKTFWWPNLRRLARKALYGV